jgi:hypothetical protein
MSLALFRSALRSAVRDAQEAPPPPRIETAPQIANQAEVLRRVARGDLTIDEALEALGDRP